MFLHPDPDVDLAVVPFHYDLKAQGYDVLYLAGLEMLEKTSDFECGDLTYTVGLFQLLAGKKRNLLVVHSGNIALLPDHLERIPVGKMKVEGYLVQSESIRGLSGAPVFVRSHVEISDFPIGHDKKAAVMLPIAGLSLLGVWQGAWDAKADAVRMASIGQDLRVPVGMGRRSPRQQAQGAIGDRGRPGE